MKREFDIETLKKFVKENKFNDGDRIYCKQYPNLVFIYETNGESLSIDNFIAHYIEGHDLYQDGVLSEIVKNNDSIFCYEPFIYNLNDE